MPDVAHQVSHAQNELSVKVKKPFFLSKPFLLTHPHSCRHVLHHIQSLSPPAQLAQLTTPGGTRATTTKSTTKTVLHPFSIPPIFEPFCYYHSDKTKNIRRLVCP